MTPTSLAYASVTKIAYPLFKPKVQDVIGLEYIPRRGGFIIAANHVDWLDGFYIAVAIGLNLGRPVYFLTKSNNYRWTTVALKIPRQPQAIIDQASKYLHGGKAICNFPEGQRNASRKLLPGKTGTVRMAIEAQVPIIPLGITCSAGKNMGQSLLYLMSNNHQVKIKIGKALTIPVPADGLSRDFLETQTERVMRAIAPLAGKTV